MADYFPAIPTMRSCSHALGVHFDHIVIDTGPKWDELTLSAMAVAHAVIAPVEASDHQRRSCECPVRSSSAIDVETVHAPTPRLMRQKPTGTSTIAAIQRVW